jgi:hypothetical protein
VLHELANSPFGELKPAPRATPIQIYPPPTHGAVS